MCGRLGGADAFWRYTDAIYARTSSGGKGFATDQLTPLATELGLDGQAFQQCLDSGRHADRVAEDLQEGSSIGITGTPGNILLNNVTGEVRLLERPATGSFDASIAELLETGGSKSQSHDASEQRTLSIPAGRISRIGTETMRENSWALI
jgi:protein-disulfide isomerase